MSTEKISLPFDARASVEDYQAAILVLSVGFMPEPPVEEAPKPVREKPPTGRNILQAWDIAGDSEMTYQVQRRVDTRHGGTYLYCTCPAWRFGRDLPKRCKHTDTVEQFDNAR